MSCKLGQLSLLKLPSAADIMKSPIVAPSPGQRPGETYAAINTFGIFVPTAQKCHAREARNPQCHGALPLIRETALTERDTFINAHAIPRALPWAMGNIWAYSPPQSFTGRLSKLVRKFVLIKVGIGVPSAASYCASNAMAVRRAKVSMLREVKPRIRLRARPSRICVILRHVR